MQPEDTSDFGHMSGEVIDYSYEDDSTSAASGFSSLIAPPSHFAISIFEKLEGVPSPLARSTATQIQADPAVRYGGYSVGVGGIGGVAVRTFAFDVPSPDDVVFKAQGHRPAVTRA
ncbi:hypothetical protein BGZ96_006275 [Linnemannia gamsii]|uniref:Uncharacterized protein n=1 Tax=Linnemannia gamsii TaxID=64522 RepID=A0ABQ7K3Z0_9FUNG|nr:hypothetical protein BGZ96_006275 [Linnemannia gamsii]